MIGLPKTASLRCHSRKTLNFHIKAYFFPRICPSLRVSKPTQIKCATSHECGCALGPINLNLGAQKPSKIVANSALWAYDFAEIESKNRPSFRRLYSRGPGCGR
jgi:hypothetical protein